MFKHLLSLLPASVSPSHRSLLPALWTTSWLLLAPHHRRRTFSQGDVSLGEETSHNGVQKLISFLCVARGETSARNPSVSFCDCNAPHTWRDFGSALPFQTRLTQTEPVLPLSNEHGSQVKDQGRWQWDHNKHKKFPYRSIRYVSLLSRHASYFPFPLLLTCASRMWALAGTIMATGTCDTEIPKWLLKRHHVLWYRYIFLINYWQSKERKWQIFVTLSLCSVTSTYLKFWLIISTV